MLNSERNSSCCCQVNFNEINLSNVLLIFIKIYWKLSIKTLKILVECTSAPVYDKYMLWINMEMIIIERRMLTRRRQICWQVRWHWSRWLTGSVLKVIYIDMILYRSSCSSGLYRYLKKIPSNPLLKTQNSKT